MSTENAFGNPDGSRTDIEDMMADFITFDNSIFSSGISDTDALKTRVIVGSKGSGKTVYLRRMQNRLKYNDSVYVTEIEHELPATALIVSFSMMFHESTLTEKWSSLWKCAIFRALVSQILFKDDLKNSLTSEDISAFNSYNDILYPQFKLSMNIYSEARNILSYYDTKNRFNNYINLREWDELEEILSKILLKLRSVYFFIDSIDDEFAHAPMFWLRCQKGLFYRVMRFFRHDVFGNKLHIVISIRDNVLTSVYESEHGTRYKQEEHIKILRWDYYSTKYFLEKKVFQLDDKYFFRNGEKNLKNWLGINEINNIKRNIKESLEQYILRHTRLLPRDIVIIGNALSELKKESKFKHNFDIETAIRKIVAREAKTFGNELLKICANQIINNEMPQDAGKNKYTEVYTSIEEYQENCSTKLKDILYKMKSDRSTWDDLVEMQKYADEILGPQNKMLSILWQNGVLGYIDDGPNDPEEVFFTDNEYGDFLLPKNKKVYVLRSCIIDAVGMESNWENTIPVIGGNI